MKAVVIIPTTGDKKVLEAIKSVENQTYADTSYLIVVDGNKFKHKFDDLFVNTDPYMPPKDVVYLKHNTGGNGFNGQRIYASFPHLIDADYIFFLDQDNWYKPNHVESLIKTLEMGNHFAYSLRSIYDEKMNYICDDNCESLGKWPIFFTYDQPQYLVDTSCFAFRKDFIQKTCHLWHSGAWGEDRRFFYAVKDHARHDISQEYSLCYRLNGNERSVKEDFFTHGNRIMQQRYNGNFPWKK